MGFFENIDPEQLFTAAGFVGFLIWQNNRLVKRIELLESERSAMVERYIGRVEQSNADLLEATRLFDKLTQAQK